MNLEQIAHDLAMAYINNRYGVNVTGSFSVESWTNLENDTVREVKGEGGVETQRLPGLFDPKMVSVGTGKKSLLGFGPEKMRQEPTSELAVDQKFRSMIADYRNAFERFRQLLEEK